MLTATLPQAHEIALDIVHFRRLYNLYRLQGNHVKMREISEIIHAITADESI